MAGGQAAPVMLPQLVVGTLLLVACVAMHGAGTMLLMRWLRRRGFAGSVDLPGRRHVRPALLLVGCFVFIALMHLAEIALWAGIFVWLGAMPTVERAVYFSMVSYTTVGYGDVVLPLEWRLLGAGEGLAGTLLTGWSTGLLFAVVARLYSRIFRD